MNILLTENQIFMKTETKEKATESCRTAVTSNNDRHIVRNYRGEKHDTSQELKNGEAIPFVLVQSSDRSFDYVVTATFEHKKSKKQRVARFRKSDFDQLRPLFKYSDERLVSWKCREENNSEKEGE